MMIFSMLSTFLFAFFAQLFLLWVAAIAMPNAVWFCREMGWHKAPKEQGFDGCSKTGICPRCGKAVLQDSQGNWF